MKVGVVGLGLMGGPIAARLVDEGHDVAVSSRRRPGDHAGRWVDSVAELIDRDVVITMLPEGNDVLDVVERLAPAHPGVIVDMSTIGPQWAARIAALADSSGSQFVDAPVSGGPAGARAGTLTVMAGGAHAAVERARAVLESLGSVHHLGPVGAGQAAKLVNQVLLAGIMAGVADAFALVESEGLDPRDVHEAVAGGMAGGRLLDFAWPRLVDGDLSPGFRISHFVKDLDLALAQGVALDLTERVRAAYASLLPDFADDGTQALVRYVRSEPTPSSTARETP